MPTSITEYDLSNRSVIIIVGTPFQALCAIEAIKRFNIHNYKIYVWEYVNDNRRTQTFCILSHFDIEATPIIATRFTWLKHFVKDIWTKKSYDYAILGDVSTQDYRIYVLGKLKQASPILYLDDGSASIAVFQGLKSIGGGLFPYKKCIDKFVSLIKKLNNPRKFFTIFHDIPTQRYTLIANNFSHISSLQKNIPVENEYIFIGTSPQAYIKVYDITLEEYKQMAIKLLKQIKHQYQKVTYIPHGRDYDNILAPLCQENGIAYMRINVCIELHLLQRNTIISAVGGFTSTALFTIKKIFPKTMVYNYLPNKKSAYSNIYEQISEYYQKHGIDIVNIT